MYKLPCRKLKKYNIEEKQMHEREVKEKNNKRELLTSFFRLGYFHILNSTLMSHPLKLRLLGFCKYCISEKGTVEVCNQITEQTYNSRISAKNPSGQSHGNRNFLEL